MCCCFLNGTQNIIIIIIIISIIIIIKLFPTVRLPLIKMYKDRYEID